MGAVSCFYCGGGGMMEGCPICLRSSNPRFRVSRRDVDDVLGRNTQPPDALDGFFEGIAEGDSQKTNHYADKLRESGASDSFLSLCARLIKGLFLVAISWAFF